MLSCADRERIISASQRILERGGWCLLEVCTDVPEQRWETRLVIFDLTPEAIADAVTEEIAAAPELDLRLHGCDRRTLQPVADIDPQLCYLAEPGPAAAWSW